MPDLLSSPDGEDFFVSRLKPPRSGERVQGTKFLAGVWGKAPSRVWGGNPIVTPNRESIQLIIKYQGAKRNLIPLTPH